MQKMINHFSHEEHPLILMELKAPGDSAAAAANFVCYGCQQPILTGSTTYCCIECDDVFLHKSCAELPLEINHPMHPEHPLQLLEKPPYRSGKCTCNICRRKDWSGFTYNCSKCEFDVDILCAQVPDTYKIPNHPHPLKLHKRAAMFFCDACGKEDKDESYYCTVCPFWIHKSCGLLQSSDSYKSHPLHDAPLLLSDCLPEEYRHYKLRCDICQEKIHPSYWVYYCGPCRYFVHLKCYTSKSNQDEAAEAYFAGEIPPNSISLPAEVISSQLIQHFLEENGLIGLVGKPTKIYHFSHDHPLIVTDIQDDYSEMDDDDQETMCNCCAEPISGPCYGCAPCSYFIHLHCAKLPHTLSSSYHPEHKLSIAYYTKCFVLDECSKCKQFCNGFFYRCDECKIFLDIKCALFPKTIKHEAHDHLLVQNESSKRLLCKSRRHYTTDFSYSCKHCDYNIGLECITLPRSVRHTWDDHSLILSFPPFYYHPDPFMCDMCEEEIHPKFWLYHCRECDNSFHPNCIPRLGHYPKMKFGDKLQIDYHPHPLTFIREVKYKFSCDKCGRTLERRMAFECNTCYFYICKPCTQKAFILRLLFNAEKSNLEVVQGGR